ncbi:class I SAM-dependent methyltransferase [Candidatus Woesearchaeota archaeon]|nr:class I SAM-dependent methyltransferase [Candidatus Woesearchaeota archaeon]
MNNREKTFTKIYEEHIWGNPEKDIVWSGPGSTLENTKLVRELLDNFIEENQIKSILDLGCGDLNWIPETRFFNNKDIKYTGIEIYNELVKKHKEKYKDKNFIQGDIVEKKDIPFSDLIILRDVIFHLKNKDVKKIFKNLRNKFKYIAITSCKNHYNHDFFDKWNFAPRNINLGPYYINNNFSNKIYEEKFNRDFLIYSHNEFYKAKILSFERYDYIRRKIKYLFKNDFKPN